MKFLFAAIAVLMPVTVRAGGPPDPLDCPGQSPCITFEVIPKCSALCSHQCEYEVCMTYDLDADGCVKNGESISHSCEKADNVCVLDTQPAAGTVGENFQSAAEVQSVPNNYKQCQTVPPGAYVEFLVKDGRTCSGSSHTKTLDIFGLEADCRPTDEKSCTGNGNIEKECVWSLIVPDATECPSCGGGGGDPHIKRWNRKPFEFHGECDMVLVHSDHVNGDKTLDIHIRTAIDKFWSQIVSAAMRVGESTLQMDTDRFFIDGTEMTDAALPLQTPEFNMKMVNGHHAITQSLRASEQKGTLKTYIVTFNDRSIITFKILNGFLNVAVTGSPHDFKESVGLMGTYDLGKPIDRNGERMYDLEMFAFEWQVDPSKDPILFNEAKGPQLPHETCRMPSPEAVARRRHLRDNSELVEKAMFACAGKVDDEACQADVINTGDASMALLYDGV